MRPRSFQQPLPQNAAAEVQEIEVLAGAPPRSDDIRGGLRLVSRRGYSVRVENDTAWQDAVDAWRALRLGR
jgi:hypothetical protein